MSIFYLIAGLLFLVVGGEFLVRSSVGLSFKLNLSKLVIGMTVVSFATSAPELIVSLQAALKIFLHDFCGILPSKLRDNIHGFYRMLYNLYTLFLPIFL